MNIILYEILISLSTGLMYFLTAAGMSIVVSGMNVINFGQGQFYMLGTLICFSLWKLTGSFALSVIAAMLIVGLCGGFITEHLLRPLYGKPMLYQLLLDDGHWLCDSGHVCDVLGKQYCNDEGPIVSQLPRQNAGYEISRILPVFDCSQLCYLHHYAVRFQKDENRYDVSGDYHEPRHGFLHGRQCKKAEHHHDDGRHRPECVGRALNLCITGTTTTAEPTVTSTAMCILIIGGIAGNQRRVWLLRCW